MRAVEGTVEDLVMAARDGDELAWSGLMDRFDGMVRGVAASFRFQKADADDVVQATWLSAIEQIGMLRSPERFGGWLRAIARNECRDVCLRAARERPADEVGDAVVEPSPGPEALVLRAEVVRAVGEALAALPHRSRVLVDCLFFAPESDYASAARTLGMPLGGIGPTRSRALLVLRERMARRGHGPAPVVARAG